jgi:oxalate---CoA ligase
LHITGRIKETINRGGEKIAPLEIDRVFSEHPLVDEAAAFAISDPVLGEEVALAVVPGATTPSEDDLLAFAARRLSAFKLPCRVVLLQSLPRGPTGKIRRDLLRHQFEKDVRKGSTGHDGYVKASADPVGQSMERLVRSIWQDVFGVADIAVNMRFSDLGGSSANVGQVLVALEAALGQPVPLRLVLKTPTIAQTASALNAAGFRARERLAL